MSNSVRKPIAAAAPLHIAARPATVSATALGTAMQPRATDAPSAAVVVSLVEFIIVVVVIVVELVASTTCVKLAKLQASCLVSRARIKLQTGCQGTRNLSIASRKIKRGMAILAISLPRISSQRRSEQCGKLHVWSRFASPVLDHTGACIYTHLFDCTDFMLSHAVRTKATPFASSDISRGAAQTSTARPNYPWLVPSLVSRAKGGRYPVSSLQTPANTLSRSECRIQVFFGPAKRQS